MKFRTKLGFLFALTMLTILVVMNMQKKTIEVPGIVEISSADKGLTLQIPDGALPDGVSAADIKAEPYAEGEMPYALKAGKLIGYKLLPDGLVFKKPITAVMNYTSESSGIPALFHLGKDSVEPIENPKFHFVRDANGKTTVTASVELAHFSGIARSEEELFNIHTQLGDRGYPLYVDIPFVFTIAPQPETAYSVTDSRSSALIALYGVQPGTRYQVNTNNTEKNSRFWSRGSRIQPDVPLPAQDLAHDETYRVAQTVRCQSLGDEHFDSTFITILYTRSDYYARSQLSGTSSQTIYASYDDHYLCMEPPKEAHTNAVSSGGTPVSPTSNKVSAPKANPTAAPKSSGVITVCGLPGGPACPKR